MDVMKMETPVKAPCDGKVHAIMVNQTDKVNTGDLLVVLC
jgi:biotin carboxyl carrier protein